MIAHSFGLSSTRTAFLGALVLGAISLPGATAWAQGSDMQILLDRMERLERDIRTLNQQIARAPVAVVPEGSSITDGVAVEATTPTPTPAPAIAFNEGEGALARVTVRLSSLEQEVRQATGLAEGMSYSVSQITARLDKLITDLDYRLARLEGGAMGSLGGGTQPTVSAAPSPPSVSKVGEMTAPTAEMSTGVREKGKLDANGTYIPPKSGGGTLGSISKNTLDQFMPADENVEGQPGPEQVQMAAAPIGQPNAAPMQGEPATPAAMPAPAATPEPKGVLPDGSPRERYQFAFGLMSQARYDDAEVALKEFIAKHGEDPLAANAWYWLGETHYVRKSFMDAAQTFFQAYKIAPEGAKAPDSLLKLGMSMSNLDKTEEACTTFGKLRKEFTDLKSSITTKLNRETKRLKCQ